MTQHRTICKFLLSQSADISIPLDSRMTLRTLFLFILKCEDFISESNMLVTRGTEWTLFRKIGPARITDNARDFQRFLRDIIIQGGGDCPEMSISAIKAALEISLPASSIYVFTDARAKDYSLTDSVIELIQKTHSQIVFVLTGDCGNQNHPGYETYEKLAATSSGQLLNFIQLTLTTKKVNLLSYDKVNGENEIIILPVDSNLQSLTISLSGERDSVNIIDPNDVPLVYSIPNVKSKKGQNTTLLCIIKSEVPILLQWSKNSTILKSQQFLSGKNNATYVLQNIKTSDRGRYFCNASNPSGWSMADINLNIITPRIKNKKEIVNKEKNNFKNFHRNAFFDISHLELIDNLEHQNITGIFKKNLKLMCPIRYELSYRYSKKNYPITVSWFKDSVNSYELISSNMMTINQISNKYKYKLLNNYPDKEDMKYIIFADDIEENYIDYNIYRNALQYKNLTYNNIDYIFGLLINELSDDDKGLYVCRVETPTNNAMDAYIVGIGDDYITIKGAGEAEAGVYTCTGYNSIGIKHDSMLLRMSESPKIIVDRPQRLVRIGKSEKLICDISYDKKSRSNTYNWIWFKNGKRMYNETNRVIYKNEMTFTNIQPVDIGTYICQIENNNSNSQASISIELGSSPIIFHDQLHKDINEGENIYLMCSPIGTPTPKLNWYFTPKHFDMDDNIYPKSINERQKIAIPLTHKSKYNITEGMGLLIKRQNITLKCPIESNPKPEFTWIKNRRNWIIPKNYKLLENGKHILISQVSPNDRAIYTCSGSNIYGQADFDLRLDLIVSPKIIYPIKNINVINVIILNKQFPKNKTIKCIANGYPLPKILWKQNGYVIENSSILHINEKLFKRNMQVSLSCQANNLGGQDEIFVNINLDKPAMSTLKAQFKSHIIIKKNTNTTIKCENREHLGPLHIYWEKDGKIINSDLYSYQMFNNHDGSELTVLNAQIKDSGKYICHINDDSTRSKQTWYLSIHEPPVIEGSSYAEIKTNVGKNISMLCNINFNSSPNLKIIWKQNNKPIQHIEKNKSFLNIIRHNRSISELRINYISEENFRIPFICEAQNEVGIAKKYFIISRSDDKIQPTYKEYTNIDKTLYYKFNDTITIRCPITKSMTIEGLEWYFKQENLLDYTLLDKDSQNDDFIFSDNISLTIPKAHPKYSGLYKCEENEKIYQRYEIKILSKPLIFKNQLINSGIFEETDRPISYNAIEGFPILLTCKIYGIPHPKTKWIHYKAMDIEIKNNTKDRIIILEELQYFDPLNDYYIDKNSYNNSLIIYNAEHNKSKHNGLFACESENSQGKGRKVFDVNVIVFPKINPPFSTISGFLSRPLQLFCHASGFPQPKITWFKQEDKRITINNSNRIHIANDSSSIVIHNLDLKDEGSYQCVAENKAGIATSHISVNIYRKPQINKSNNSRNIVTVEKNPFTLPCLIVGGTPKPHIVWYKENNKISEFDSKYKLLKSGNLLIIMTSEEDAGSYRCEAKNIAGTVDSQIQLIVQVSPIIEKPRLNKYIVKEHDYIELVCEVIRGYPRPDVSWHKDKIIIDRFNRRGDIDITNTFVIFSAKKADSGIYKCIATNSAGEYQIEYSVIVS
ncbi:unnamed protein product [Gordionus sp. m RMFG-2023]